MSETRRQGMLRTPVGDDDHQAGPVDAPLTLVEYGDFQCPFCFRAHPVVMALQARFGSRLRFVFRNFPLSEIHPHARNAAEAAESVNQRAGSDAYWRMHHLIFEHQQDSKDALDDAHLLRYAAEAGADPLEVQRDLDMHAYAQRVDADFASGVRSGVNGTPTFFINGQRYDGDWTRINQFAEAIEQSIA